MGEVARGSASPIGERREGEVRPNERAPLWRHVQPGQLLELSGKGPGKLSTAARLIAYAQAEGEPVAWVTPRDAASFYPPDFAAVGVALDALVVVRLPGEAKGHALVRACEVLLRSGAFGCAVIDFAQTELPGGALAWQARLSGLARLHAARVVLITASASDRPSVGPLVSLRVSPELRSEAGRAVLAQRVLKSKLGAAARVSPDVRALPIGARAALGT